MCGCRMGLTLSVPSAVERCAQYPLGYDLNVTCFREYGCSARNRVSIFRGIDD